VWRGWCGLVFVCGMKEGNCRREVLGAENLYWQQTKRRTDWKVGQNTRNSFLPQKPIYQLVCLGGFRLGGLAFSFLFFSFLFFFEIFLLPFLSSTSSQPLLLINFSSSSFFSRHVTPSPHPFSHFCFVFFFFFLIS